MRHAGDPTRVLIADRPGPARRALALVLTGLPDIAVVGAEGGTTMGRAVRELRPDVVVIDDRLVDSWQSPFGQDVRLIVVGADDAPGYSERAERVHAVTWLPKECAGERLADAVHAARRSLSRPREPGPAEPALARHGRAGAP